MLNKPVAKHRDIDGGYAWIILFSAFISFGLGTGTRQIFGILYIEILDMYQAGEYVHILDYHVTDGFLGIIR